MDDSLLVLTDRDVAHMASLSSSLSANPSEQPDLFCAQAKDLSALLPYHIMTRLKHFAQHSSSTGYLLIRPAPTEEVETPPVTTRHVGETTVLARIQALCMSVISDMIAYEAEGQGRLFQDIVPVRSMATIQTSTSSSELEIHTEQAFSSLRPDYLSLACLRGDPGALTYVLPLQTILKNLTEEEQQLLRQPLWNTGVDLSFKIHGQEFIEGDVRVPMPILSDSTLIFDQDLMTGTTEASNKMIDTIVDLYYKNRLSHCLVPGDILILDNQRAVHGRSQYRPAYNGKDRFLIRCFGVLDLTRSEYARRGRVIAAQYS